MCGIFGYVGSRKTDRTVIDGLKRLEYRGYDSAGIAGVQNKEIVFCKEVGKVAVLETGSEKQNLIPCSYCPDPLGDAWQSDKSKCPSSFGSKSLALSIMASLKITISLRKAIKAKGVLFISDTDTEVIAHLIASYYQGDILQAVQKAVAQLKGAYASPLSIAIIPDQIIAIAHEAPLVIGIGNNEAFISSDPHAFAFYTRQAIYLSNSEIAVIKADSQQVYSAEAHRQRNVIF